MPAPDQACRKFQANIFNQSKCQNCFKSRDSHLVSERDLSQVKPVYGGWLLLAPEGTNFDNPGQRSKKWQRRFFILYEHGLLHYALDEMPTTLPQGSINMNHSIDVLEGESITTHKYSLCISTPEKQHFIRAENRETINGWFETLIVYPRTNKQNPKKKRKVESPPAQEAGLAKIAVTQCCIPGPEKIPSNKSTLWQEELPETRNHPPHCPQSTSPMAVSSRISVLDEGPGTKEATSTARPSDRGGQHRSDCSSLEKLPAASKPLGSLPATGSFRRYSCPDSGRVASCSPQLSCHPFPSTGHSLSISASLCSLGSGTSSNAGPLDTLVLGPEHCVYGTVADFLRAKRNSHRKAFRAEHRNLERQARARSPGSEEVIRMFGYERRKSQVIEQFEALQMEARSEGDTKIKNETRQGRSETRIVSRKRECVSESGNLSSGPPPLCPRNTSLDRRVTECTVTPDLLNFKKGWVAKLSQDGQWKKHWFVLTDRFLRFHRDSVAEEAVDLDGEIDLNGCSEATECEVQKNYGFQIHTRAGVYVLSVMTSGIRNSWIQAIMKNVRPATTPDVASHVMEQRSEARTLFEGSSRMGTKAEGNCVEMELKHSRTRERRREGRSKTFDWAEFCRVPKAKVASSAGDPVRPTSLYLSNSSATETDPRELERNRIQRREERRRRFETVDGSHSPRCEAVTRLDVDGSISSPTTTRPENVSVEIEQRWHQVESTQLREEKQVPIPILGVQANGQGRLPAQEPRALTTELERAQRELRNLNEQNQQLQGQLQVSLERARSARDGYILQTKVTSLSRTLETHQPANPHQPSQFGAECGQWALNRECEKTRDLNHILKGLENEEQTTHQQLDKWQQLGTEQQQSKDTEEWEQERTLNLQLGESVERLEAEVQFLEKTQDLRELERQQASQRGHVQTPRDSIQLCASDQDRLTEEEMVQKHYEIFKQNDAKEKAIQPQMLRKVEESLEQYENHLGDSEEQLDDSQREKRRNSSQRSQMSQQLEEQDVTVQILSQSLTQCEKEKLQLLEKAKRKAAKQQDQLGEILMLKNSHKQLTQQLQATCELLDDKSRELNEVKDVYENLIENKDRMLNEAVIKLCALENNLEETEKQLQAQTSLLQQLSPRDASTHTLNHQDNLHNKLSTAEKQISELKQQLDMLQVEDKALELKNTTLSRLQRYEACEESGTELKAELTSAEPDLIQNGVVKGVIGGDSSTFPKLQRIRFSRIQCHKYTAGDGAGKLWGYGLASEISQGRSLSLDEAPLYAASSKGSEIGKEHLSSDEKLKATTFRLEKVADQDVLNPKMIKPETQLCKQLQESVFRADSVTIQLEVEKAKRWKLIQNLNSHMGTIELQYGQVCSLIETCEHSVQVLLQESNKTSSVHLHTLLEVQNGVANAIHCLEKVGRSLEQQHRELQDAHEQIHNGLSDRAMLLRGQFLLARERELSQQQEMSNQDKVKLFYDKLAFEALILNKMAETLQNGASDTATSGSLCEEFEVFESEADNVADSTSEPNSTVDFAEILLKKIISEGEFWIEVEKLRKNIRPKEDQDEECDAVLINAFASKAAQSASLKAELSLTVQKVKEFFRRKVQNLEQEIQAARQEIREKDNALSKVLDLSKSPAQSEFVQLVKEVPEGKMFNVRHPELIISQIESEESGSLALNVVEKHFNEIPRMKQEECDSLARAELSGHLKERANILQQLAEGLQSLSQGEAEKICQKLLEVSQVLASYVYVRNVSNYASVLVQEAEIQAQISYIVCKMQTDCKEEHKRYKDLCSNTEALCGKHAKNVAAIRLKYEEILHKEWQGYTEALATLEKENEALKHQNSHLDTELALKQTLLQEMVKKHQDSLPQVQNQCELEIKAIHKNLERLEAADQNTLGVALREAESQKDCQRAKIKELEECFHSKVQELSRAHEAEKHQLHAEYEQRVRALENALEHKRENSESLRKRSNVTEEDVGPMRGQLLGDVGQAERSVHLDSMTMLQKRIEELETQMILMRNELEQKVLEGNAADQKEKNQKDFDNLKATCERAFTAMEGSHYKVVEDLQRQHQREREMLEREKQRLLAEETAATIAAIEAMKNAHREELEREQEKTQRSQISGMNSDTEAMHRQHMEEIESVQRELEVLSEQYSHKCLENAHLAQALEAERQALRQCQQENQELNAHNQELNNRLAAEFARLRELVTGEGRGDGAGSRSSQGKDGYELEVLLRVKQSEIQYLKQEISSLKDELQTTLRDKKYSTDKYKDIYTELSIVRAKADCDINRLREQLKEATEVQCGGSADVSVYDIMKSKSNPDFLKSKQSGYALRTLRSKSLKEGLTIQERMKLFESKDSRKL